MGERRERRLVSALSPSTHRNPLSLFSLSSMRSLFVEVAEWKQKGKTEIYKK